MNQLHTVCSTNMVAIDYTQDLVIEITVRKDTFGRLRQFGRIPMPSVLRFAWYCSVDASCCVEA